MLSILFDADMILHRACQAVQKNVDFYDLGVSQMICDHAELIECISNTVQSIVEKVVNHYQYEGDFVVRMAFSDKENFRKKVNPEYKANRNGKLKPTGYTAGIHFMNEMYTCLQYPNLEADDILSIYATTYPNDTVIVSGDKDMHCIPARFYNFLQDTFEEISVEQANYYVLFQTLIGDATDNYKGCPGIGPVAAKRILDKDCSWETVVNEFEKKGLTENDALLNARMAFLLRKGHYAMNTGEVKLFTPDICRVAS